MQFPTILYTSSPDETERIGAELASAILEDSKLPRFIALLLRAAPFFLLLLHPPKPPHFSRKLRFIIIMNSEKPRYVRGIVKKVPLQFKKIVI